MGSRATEVAGRRFPRRSFLLACTALFVAHGIGRLARAETLPAVEAPGFRPRVEAHQLWVLELRLGGRVLNDGVLAIEREGELLLPLHELASAFDLAIEVDADSARAEGWLIHPERDFALDLGNRELRVEGARREVSPAQIIIWSGDIYVDPRSLSAWWPVDLDVDRRTLRIESVPRETLPVEQRLARERLHARLGLRQRGDSGRSAEESPYAWWSLPAADVNLFSRTLRPQLGSRDWQSGYDLATAGDLLRLHTETIWAGVAGDYSRMRLRAGRHDIDGRMGGPLHLRSFTLGDVSTPTLPFVSQTRGGRGIQVSSFPIDYYTELGQLTLEGDLRPGWDVEVYRDGLLLDFRGSSDDLRYRFEDLPTVPGLNVFRLVFHGPRGELREEERRIWSDGGLAPAGETRFRATFNQHDSDLWTTGDIGGNDELRGELRGLGEIEHGFGDAFTLALGAATLPLLEGRHHYGTLGARTQLLGSLVRADVLAGHDGGWGAGAGWQTRLGPVSLGLSHHEFREFLSERTRERGGLRLLGRSEANVNGPLELPVLPLYYRVGVGQSRLRGGGFDTDADLRLSTWLRPVFLTHTLRGRLDRGDSAETRYVDGDLLASFRRGPYGLRGQFAYGVDPGQLTSVAALADWTPHYLTTTRLGVMHMFGDRTALLASLSRRIGVVVLSASAELDEHGVAHAGVGISFGLTPDPYGGGYHWQDPGATRTSAVGARVFLDHDADGQYDEEDELLRDVGFVARGAGHTRSDASGTALLTELPVHERIDVAVDPGTIEDPHWLAPRQSERVVLRPGTPIRVDFPVVPVGEVDGWIRLGKPTGAEPLPGVSLQLVDLEGEVVQTTRSQIDGFYLFQEVVAGRYRLRVEPDQARRAGWEAPPERELVIAGAGSILSDVDLELRER